MQHRGSACPSYPRTDPDTWPPRQAQCRESIIGTKRDHAAIPQREGAVVSSTCLSHRDWCCCTGTYSPQLWTPVEKDGVCKGVLCLPYRQMCTQNRWNPLEASEAQQPSSGPSWAVGGHKFTMKNTSLKDTLLFFPQIALLCQPGSSAMLSVKAVHHSPLPLLQRSEVGSFPLPF